jgi:hypothetical protein
MFDLKGLYEHVFLSILNKYIYALIRSSTEHKLFMYLTSSIIIKRHKHQIFWDQLAIRAANNRKSKQRRGNNVL